MSTTTKPWLASSSDQRPRVETRRPSRARRLVVSLSCAYPVALLLCAIALRYVGERWWVTGVGLYLPRIGFALPLPLLAFALVVARRSVYLWTQAAAAFVLVFVLLGLTFPPLGSADPSAPAVRVLSYNVDSDQGGTEGVVAEIDRFAPDVVLLQEVGASPSLEAALRARYASVMAHDQFMMASRYSVRSTFEPDKLPFHDRLRSARYLEQTLDTPLGPVAVYDVHPLSPRDSFRTLRGHGLKREILSGRLFTGANAGPFVNNAELRAAQVEAFSERAASEAVPVVLGGDTNLPDLSWVLHRHLSGFQDGFSAAGSGFGYTFPTNRPWMRMRIDRILASRELRFTRFDVGASRASDHFCVVAELQRR